MPIGANGKRCRIVIGELGDPSFERGHVFRHMSAQNPISMRNAAATPGRHAPAPINRNQAEILSP